LDVRLRIACSSQRGTWNPAIRRGAVAKLTEFVATPSPDGAIFPPRYGMVAACREVDNSLGLEFN
jgi:hypothetical protein